MSENEQLVAITWLHYLAEQIQAGAILEFNLKHIAPPFGRTTVEISIEPLRDEYLYPPELNG